ncbi:MAG: RidA family protein [Chloroflexota bacterium]|nr:RidA family protein [Chloroflexota bacterium]
MADTERKVVSTDLAPAPLGAYSQAIRVKAGELLYIAGQVGVDRDGNLPGDGGMAAQTRQVYENLRGILDSVGASFSDVVEFTTYVVGRESVQPFMAARAEIFPSLFPDGDYPPNTLLVISGLVREEFLVEIKAVAALP